ncbi:acyltransferase [Arsenicitalea aurantiaca]|uniref:Acyltransferase n=1 Tax=Arsenicitalea aurantiaca TaxID=1783274 RepID=A0A433XG38_9HYPH|nr:acyltransferase family protein [Arsenicitalea aurantiaca]RUT33087.1 acyltransferase [Arsenicitalea aurantiaca]
MAEAGERLGWVDVAKGISIILVVMMHSAYGVGAETGDIGFLHHVIAWAAPFRMPEFFLISGLFLAQVIGRDWLRYADRRVVHYFYFYVLWAIIHIVFKEAIVDRDPALAANYLAWAVIQPYGVLWFIYMLGVFSLVAKVIFTARIPHWAALLVAALLQIAPIATGWRIIDEFCAYFVFFYAGYALAPFVFSLVSRAVARPLLALAGLALWAVLNGILVFSGGAELAPDHFIMGIAGLPVLHLVLALIGSIALCIGAGLLAPLRSMAWLGWLGAHSIVVYLAFALPMGAIRLVLLRLEIINDTGLLSLVVLVGSIVLPLMLYWAIERTGWGRFLFERPAWAHLPGAPGSLRPTPALRTPAQ